METNNMANIGVEVLIVNMMIHSLSPQGRRLVEQMYTGDPFHIDIKLNSDSRNRSAEIVNTYLKTIGRRLKFIKRRKTYTKITFSPVEFTEDPYIDPLIPIPIEDRDKFDIEKEFKKRQKLLKEMDKKGTSPIIFYGSNPDMDEDFESVEEEEIKTTDEY